MSFISVGGAGLRETQLDTSGLKPEAFRTFISSLRNFHHGVASHWELVDWERIHMTQWMEM